MLKKKDKLKQILKQHPMMYAKNAQTIKALKKFEIQFTIFKCKISLGDFFKNFLYFLMFSICCRTFKLLQYSCTQNA